MGALRTLLVVTLWLPAQVAIGAAQDDQPILFETYGGLLCERTDTGEWRCEGATDAARAARAAREEAHRAQSARTAPPVPAGAPAPDATGEAATTPVDPAAIAAAVEPPRGEPFAPVPDLAAALWTPLAELPQHLRDTLPPYCAGRYVEDTFPYPLDVVSDSVPIEVEADSAGYDVGEEVQLAGNVTIAQGNRRLRAARAVIDEPNRIAAITGGVQLREPGLVTQGETAEVNLNTRGARLDDAQFVVMDGQFRGEAETVTRDGEGNLQMLDVGFTRCDPGSDGWMIAARQFDLPDGEVFGTARDATVRVGGVPVFYTPYLKFPVSDDRVTGFLFPDLEYSNQDGFDLTAPYYLNLAPNYDATLTPRWISERGAGLEGEFRHRSQWQETSVGGAYLPDDDLFNGTLDRDDWEDEQASGGAVPPQFDPADRWLYSMDHRGRAGRVSTRVDYTAVSDRDYFRDLGTDLAVSSRIQLERLGEVRYDHGGFGMRLWGQRFQRIDDIERDEYERLPELEANYAFDLGPFDVSLAGEAASFDRDYDGETGIDALTGNRLHLEPRIILPFTWPAGFLSFSGGYRFTRYDLESETDMLDDERPERDIAFGSVNGGLVFERELEWFGKPLVQTLEPRAFYFYQEFEDQSQLPLFDGKELTFSYLQLYRDNRFTGLDRIGDANQVSGGVTTRFLSRVDGREYFRASLGEIYYFEDREVTLRGAPTEDDFHSTSALAAELAARVGDWIVGGSVAWDSHDNQVDESGVMVGYRPDARRLVNLGYRNRVINDIEQGDFSVYWPVSLRFSVMGRWNYDFVSGRTIEAFGGIEYNDCCWQLRLMARRFLDAPSNDFENVQADDGIFLQVGFRGLGGFGNRIESVLEHGIRGYRTENFSAH